MKIPSILTGAMALVSLSAFGAGYDLDCRFNATKFKDISFRLNGHYEPGEGTITSYKGLAFMDSSLMYIEVYDGGREALKADASYKPKKDRWADHLKFNLESLDGPGLNPNSGGTNYLLISKEPTSVTTERVDNVPNPGTKYHVTFHAGLEYYISDVGERTEITCTGLDYVSDASLKKKKQ